MGKSGQHSHGSGGKSGLNKTSVKKMIASEINKTQEIKVKYVEIDEVITAMGGQNTFDEFTNLSQGNAPDQRIGDRVRPKQLVVEGWIRPKKLISESAIDNFQVAGFTRLSLLKQASSVRTDSNIDADPTPVDFGTARLFLGAGGRTVIVNGDYKDIMRPWNYKVVRPVKKSDDRTLFFPMQGGMNNTRRFKFVVNFKQDAQINWTTSGAYSNDGIFILSMINRLATDDVEDPYDLEICGESRFYYYDA
ncbi:MAG: hypothetical protein [Circular genetic element sp.]|nr:MAG: hypothetical protein [Circular genetic element sp.]